MISKYIEWFKSWWTHMCVDLRSTHTFRPGHTQHPMRMKQHIFLNLKAKEHARSNIWTSSSTLRFSNFEPLQLTFLSGIKHGFHSNHVHHFHLYTHEPLIGSEYGVFHKSTKDKTNLNKKLSGECSNIETQTMRLNISESNGMEW